LAWKTHNFALLNLVLSLAWIALAVVMGRGYARKAQANMINVAPEVVEPIPDLQLAPGRLFVHPVSPTAFHEADPGDVVILRACRDDGRRLPRWLRFDAGQRAFVGIAPLEFEFTELRVAVIASNMDGLEARSMFVVRRLTN
jgi:hypothetical protein